MGAVGNGLRSLRVRLHRFGNDRRIKGYLDNAVVGVGWQPIAKRS
jgi:hypothetical protein